MVVLLVALFAPTLFPAIAVAVEVPLVFVLATWLAHRTPALMRSIVPPARRRAQVERAIADNDEVKTYVRELEARIDAQDAEEQGVVLDTGELDAGQFVDEVERFLREQGEGES